MVICGYEKFSMVDYDEKIACTVFTGGCNFRCPFCHNAPLVVGNVAKERMDEQEVLDYLCKRKGLVDAVCVSGGEPTLQPDLQDFVKRVRDMGYLVKLDTNGTRPDVVKELLDKGLLDYVAMDVKNSPEKYAQTVGLDSVDISSISKSIELIKTSGVAHEFRTTLIKEFHSASDIEKIADWISGADAYFMQKYKDNEGCISHGFTAFDKSELEPFVSIMSNKVKKTGTRGY